MGIDHSNPYIHSTTVLIAQHVVMVNDDTYTYTLTIHHITRIIIAKGRKL